MPYILQLLIIYWIYYINVSAEFISAPYDSGFDDTFTIDISITVK